MAVNNPFFPGKNFPPALQNFPSIKFLNKIVYILRFVIELSANYSKVKLILNLLKGYRYGQGR